jgi:hypothetical protein
MKRILFLLLAACLLAGCKSPQATKLSGPEKDAVLAYSETMTDNLMAGMNADDYTVFSKDFDKVMQYSMPEGAFEYMKQDRDAKLGEYVSRQVQDVALGNDGSITVIYNAVFKRDPDVIMRVVFRADEPHRISGLWFNK